MKKTEEVLLKLLSESLQPDLGVCERPALSQEELGQIMELAERHRVLSLLYDTLQKQEGLSALQKENLQKRARTIVAQQYRLLFLTRWVIALLEENDIPAVLLKGVAIGAYYPVPELRKSGDVDILLLYPADGERARKLLGENGFEEEKAQMARHHFCLHSEDGIEVELHTMLAEPFDNERMNRYLEKVLNECRNQIDRVQIMGIEFPVLKRAYFAYELLLHMLQHFLRSGFGLKLLCDWVVFWQAQSGEDTKEIYGRLVTESKIHGFSDMITRLCVKYLGLNETDVSWMYATKPGGEEAFMREILMAEEFGKTSKNRMVTMRGTSVWDYAREFHHQTQLNFPRACKWIPLLPVLWGETLVRFWFNNRRIRKTTTRAVLKEAKRRSACMKQLKLFQ